MTLKIISRTSQAPPRCEPLKRDLRPSRAGEFFSRMLANTTRPTSAIDRDEVLGEAEDRPVPMIGMWNSGSKRAPYASR